MPKGSRPRSKPYKRVLLKLSGEALAGDRGFGIEHEILKGIAKEARMIANNATIETTAIEEVHPQGIRVKADGVYIRVGGWLADEWGFFVPRDPAFKPAPDAVEPSFKLLGEGVWHYYFAA